MKRLWLAVLGGILGFGLTAREEIAAACSCVGPEEWRLTLGETSAGVDRAAWEGADINLRSSGNKWWLTATERYNLELSK